MTRRTYLAVAVVMMMLTGCAKHTESGLWVLVHIAPSASSKCVQVIARSGTLDERTPAMKIGARTELQVGIAQGTRPSILRLQAVGFSDEACTTLTAPAESSALVDGTFEANKIVPVDLTLAPVVPLTETGRCDNGLDDDRDGLIDCADPDCDQALCHSGDLCITETHCSNKACQGGTLVACTAPPSSCFERTGQCQVGSDAGCQYAPTPGASCDDSNPCTVSDHCDPDGGCGGSPKVCDAPPGQCFGATGTCAVDGGCVYTLTPAATCDDGQNCTVSDTCGNDGVCRGTQVTCADTACGAATGACTLDGGCVLTPRNEGLPCDAGTCNATGTCIPSFPYAPSNFTEGQVPTPPGPVVLDCGETVVDTSGTGLPTLSNWCASAPQPGMATWVEDGGTRVVLLSFSTLQISTGAQLTVKGSRPLIIAALANVDVYGAVVAQAGAADCAVGAGGGGTVSPGNGGGGGGAFGTLGGAGGSGFATLNSTAAVGGLAGGVEGTAELVPLRGGCAGGTGGSANVTSRAAGGGALQISTAGRLYVGGTINAPGHGGAGGGGNVLAATGGNGGGSGGALLLEAQSLALGPTSATTANGGAGGEGGGLISGHTGRDGQPTDAGATCDATLGAYGGVGGTGAAGSGTGTAGSDGQSLTAGGGGGGGGGAGRIRLNALLCSKSPSTTVSPPPSLGVADAGCAF
jgi:hypothetical protein